ncbi:hypothetical protein CSC81_04330 [Tenacibaculum discolor]|uniref:Lipoprotein n=1 Tax=Tenacibaculum discolor TaxID=361581 RepID=A0A2G1BXK9_9FLAO|nr:hypothetical protein [Tenacibaculum discolor]MDP2540775.1 hypothetical protein [Tenacibaculum discolor]PHN98728.1 hypothetical protein CSC81_04330 [Tenacibaculum discolor]PHN99668.1 hypothetical protein CSC82_32800 [Rhodobacteraceae bacterium 4F10]
MKQLLFFLFVCILQSCASKQYLKKHGFLSDIKSLVEETYVIENNQKKLIQTKKLHFTKNGRVKSSKTTDNLGNIIEQTEKRLWFEKRSYPNKLPYYCKTRWKPKQRERISCYTQKQYKQNEVIVYYTQKGLIDKIVDNFSTFYTHQYQYINGQLSKILVTDKDNNLVNTIKFECLSKDYKGNCLKQNKESTSSGTINIISFTFTYQ